MGHKFRKLFSKWFEYSTLGHFNVFRLDDVDVKGIKSIRKRDCYNRTLVYGNGKYLYVDKKIKVRKHAYRNKSVKVSPCLNFAILGLNSDIS